MPTTSPLTRFWLALERVPGPAAVIAEWQRLLGNDLPLISPLLTPDLELAATYPRPGGRGEPLAVVVHGPDDFVGVGEEGERPVRLLRADLVVYRLDISRLAREVAVVFGIDPDGSQVGGHAGVYCVGLYRPLAGYDYPAYLTIQLERRNHFSAIEALVASATGPFLLLAPTNRHHRIDGQLLLAQHNCAFIPLADAVQVADGGGWKRSEAADRCLGEFGAKVLPSKTEAGGGRVFFPTPAGARWSDLRIKFLDGHRVSVRVGAVARVLTFTDMGMADRRSGGPTKQWGLLQTFAEGHGRLTWRSRGSSRSNQKRRETLAQDLRAFFRLSGDPIVLAGDRKGWHCAFAVESD